MRAWLAAFGAGALYSFAAACSTEADEPGASGAGAESGAGGGSGAGADGGGAGETGAGGNGRAGAGGSDPMEGGACRAACEANVEAGCTTPESTCIEACEGFLVHCEEELSAYNTCAVTRGTISCETGPPVVTGCQEEDAELDVCLACVVVAGDNACNVCGKTECCSEYQAYIGAEDLAEFDVCLAPCETESCFDACIADYPEAGSAFEAVLECGTTRCAEQCS